MRWGVGFADGVLANKPWWGERMKHKSVISYYSLIAAMLASTPAFAGVRVGNLSRSYADSYGQVNNLRTGTVGGQNATVQNADNFRPATGLVADTGVTTAVDSTGTVVDLPVRVANAALAKRIGLGETVGRLNMATLESCRRIYPDGEFAWDNPTGGTGRGGAQTCVAVVEMRAVNADGRGGDAVLARINLAAGDNIKCNISEFPEYSYTADAGNIEFPADREPTMDDVIAQMNLEQKQNAGLKIAAGSVIGAVAGNIAGKPERGSDSLMGTGKAKMTSSVIGALSGAAIMAGNSYAGKVGGDVILSTGVNAAAGGVIGNMMASGNSVLRIEKCKTEKDEESCLWGSVVKTKDFKIGENNVVAAYYNIDTGESIVCEQSNGAVDPTCKSIALRNIRLKADANKTLDELKRENNFSVIRYNNDKQFKYDTVKQTISAGSPQNGENIYAEIASANEEDGMPVRALVPGIKNKAMGYTADDWAKENKKGLKVYGRDADGNAYDIGPDFTIENFRPTTIDAEDGGLIDISNKARLKSTLTGAGVGGAMGGFVGYQGAQSDINDRWVSAVREYKDSLTRVYCVSGRRYLGQYNDVIAIPALSEQ